MARTKGTAKLSGTIEPLAGGALDARTVVPTKADLTISANFPYAYVGLETYVVAENKKYRLISEDTTVLANWEEVGGANITVDSEISATSENPVQNKVIKGALDGKADLVSGKVPSSQLPSYVDDVIDGYFYDITHFYEEKVNGGYYNTTDNQFYEDSEFTELITPVLNEFYLDIPTDDTYKWDGTEYAEDIPTLITPEDGKVYISDDTNLEYRWGGSSYVRVNEGVVLGETSSTAYRGDRGKIAYDDSQTNKAHIGDLTELETTAKTDLVSAINEVNGKEAQTIQVDTLPLASATEEGNIYQYVGTTSGDITNGFFYKCVLKDGSYVWEQTDVQPSSGGGSLGKNITAAIDVGGVEAGDTFAQGTSYDDMWDALLNPTLYPTFTAPTASLSYTADTYYAVGATIAAKSAYVDFDQGSIDISGVEQAKRAGEATNYALASSGADTEYSGSSASSGAFNVSALTRSTKGSITLTATVSYGAGPQPKDSKGNDYGTPLAAGSVTATKTMNFIQPYYYGKSASSTIADFTGLTKDVKAKGNKTYKFTTNNEYMVIAYDSSYGNLTSILDGNGFETIGGWTKSSITVDGFTYFVYVSNSPTTDTNAAFTFKY